MEVGLLFIHPDSGDWIGSWFGSYKLSASRAVAAVEPLLPRILCRVFTNCAKMRK